MNFFGKKPIYIVRKGDKTRGGIIAAGAIHSSFIVNSISAVTKIRKVRQEFDQGTNLFQEEQKKMKRSFSDILQKEVEEVKKQSETYDFATYGIDRQLHFLGYRTREYYK